MQRREAKRAAARAYRKASVARLRVKVNYVKENTRCCRCNGNYPAVCMDFHHFKSKNQTIAAMVSGNVSWDRIQDEMDRCLLLCANCHRLEHHG